jgi:hypothetical protein
MFGFLAAFESFAHDDYALVDFDETSAVISSEDERDDGALCKLSAENFSVTKEKSNDL